MTSTLDLFDIRGRSAIVTGAASGIGLAFAEALAEAGARVTIADLRRDAAETEAERLRANGWTVRAAEIDVGDVVSVGTAFDGHASEFGVPDIVFANAGIGSGDGFRLPDGTRAPNGQIDTVDPIHWERIVRVNLLGAMNTVRHAARLMKPAKRKGSIVITSSNASSIVIPIVATAYMPSKAGVAHFVRTVALELAEYGIRVNTIAPGWFVTNISDGVLHIPEVREVWDRMVPLGSMAETTDIKALALYLASDASRFMTGSELIIDGGVSLVSQ